MKSTLVTVGVVGAAASVGVLNDVSMALFGVPVSVWASSASGALFGVAFLDSKSSLSRPWTVVASMGAGVFLSQLLGHMFGMTSPALVAGLGFVIACSPTIVVRFVIRRLTGRND